MKILIVSQWFQPESFTKGIPFAHALMARGHQVQVLTGYPNYPSGKVFGGYKIRLYQKEVMEGVTVHRVPLYPSHDSSGLRRTANYLSYAFSAAAIGPWVTEKADVIYVYHPPPTAYLPAFVLKLFRRIPVVLDIQDFWPDTLAATGMFNHPFGLRMVDRYCRFFYHRADRIAVLSPGFKQKLIEKNVPAEKIEVIYNWCDETQIESEPPTEEFLKELSFHNRFSVLFAGNMGKAQALESVLQAARILQPQNPKILFTFIGGGVEVDHLKQTAARMELRNVQFLPARPRSEIGRVLNAADVLLVHLKEDPLFRITIPSKIQAYMYVGKPILAAVSGDAADLVEQAGAGLACPSEKPERLAECVLRFAEMSAQERMQMGQRGREFYQKYLSMEAGVERFERLFAEAVSASREKRGRKGAARL